MLITCKELHWSHQQESVVEWATAYHTTISAMYTLCTYQIFLTTISAIYTCHTFTAIRSTTLYYAITCHTVALQADCCLISRVCGRAGNSQELMTFSHLAFPCAPPPPPNQHICFLIIILSLPSDKICWTKTV